MNPAQIVLKGRVSTLTISELDRETDEYTYHFLYEDGTIWEWQMPRGIGAELNLFLSGYDEQSLSKVLWEKKEIKRIEKDAYKNGFRDGKEGKTDRVIDEWLNTR